jgi:ubiquinone/menaquinone biosynthesis C-methylase UbiE
MAFEELKQRHSVVWGSAPFENICDSIADVHEAIVVALTPADGKRWLDVACGTGGVTERAVAAGADVVGVDIAPVLIETAKRLAADRGLEIDYRVGDAENLEFEDASFDVVSSTFGTMFAPDQEAVARELARVTRPGGRLGLANWTPAGGIGAMFRLLAEFQPPPPPGAGMPLDWGRREHVEELLGDDFELEIEERMSPLRMDSAEAYWQWLSPNFGPLKTLVESLDDARREQLHDVWVEFLETDFGSPGGPIEHSREYLLVLGTPK